MRTQRHTLFALGLAALLAWPGAARAHDTSFEGTSPEVEVVETEKVEEWADDWFTNRSKREDYGDDSGKKDGEDSEEEKKKSRKYLRIYEDASFAYYMDKENTKWIPMPYRNQKMLDVWVRLVPIDEAADCETVEAAGLEYPFKKHYFLEHYYMKLHPEKIQFLCELEVTGRPNNDVATGRYNPAAWEELVPGSIEDRIFHKVMAYYKGTLRKAEETKTTDFLEDVFRISI